MDQKAGRKRRDQRTEDTWRLEDLYASDEAYEEDVRRLESERKAFAARKGDVLKGPQSLASVLADYAAMSRRADRIYVYATQRYHEDTANPVYQKMSGEAQLLMTRLGGAVSWLEPEILAVPQEELRLWLQSPELSEYRRFIEQITRKRAHILDAQTEALLARVTDLGGAPSNIFSMFNNADVRFREVRGEDGKRHPLTAGTYLSYQRSGDRVLRKDAFEALYEVYGQFSNTLAAMYDANARQADFFARERHYANAMEAALDASAVPTEVYTNLVAAVNRKLDLMHRYMRLRKRLLGVSELHMYDVYVPVLPEAGRHSYSFEEAKEIVLRGLAPLGEEYLELLRQGFADRWIDIYENKGKRTGAYSWGAYGTHPYVLLNYQGNLEDVFTLAHEMGHALHTWHSDHARQYLDAGYHIFVAEVASTCNEALLIRYLLDQTKDRAERLFLINHFLDQFKSTVFRQTMFAEFEMKTHQTVEQGGSLTAEALCKTYLELNRRYHGEDVVSDPEIQYEWSRIPHFYTPFYVYQYATGFAAAIAISSKILAKEEGIVEKYRRFLSGGCSMDPIDLLRICGVDMSSPRPVEEALKVFEAYLAELESLTH